MGRLYESLRKNIELIRKVDAKLKNREIIDTTTAFEVTMALRKVNYVVHYCHIHCPNRFLSLGPLPQEGAVRYFNLPP